jgi:hypothetical protein
LNFWSPPERREAIRSSNAAHEAEAFQTYRGGDGFQETRWGMSPEEVQTLYPDARRTTSRGDLRATTEVADRSATVDFFFVQDKLAAVEVEFDTSAPLREEFDALSELLGMKYGQPVADKDTAAEAEERLSYYESENRRTESTATLRELGTGRRSRRDPVEPKDREREEEARIDALQAQNDYALRQAWKNSETELFLSGRQAPDGKRLTLEYTSRYLKQYAEPAREASERQLQREQAQDL